MRQRSITDQRRTQTTKFPAIIMRQPPLLSLLASSLLYLSASQAWADRLFDFEGDTVDTPPPGWVFDGDSSTVRVAATSASGDYPGVQGIRTDEGGASYAGYVYPGPTITSIQADFLWDFSEFNTPTLAVYAWDDDDGDGFQAGERTIGFGLDNDGQFELSSEAGELAGTSDFEADTWYRLTMTWSEAEISGDRTVTLTAFDLTNSLDLGEVATATMSADDFGVSPSEWDGIAFRMTRGTIDNIRIASRPGAFAYVDATPLNTTLNFDPENFPNGVPLEAGTNFINDGTGGNGADSLWTYRTDAAFATFENGTAFEIDNLSSAEDAEMTPDLITTISIPVPGTYDLVAVFTRISNRDIAARIGERPALGDIFSAPYALNTNQAADPLEISFDSSFANGRLANSGAAYLGTVTTSTANEDVRVFVNGPARTAAIDDERTQYDGIGYRPTTGGVSQGLQITGINYAPNADPVPTVTLTWSNTGAATYVAKFSVDMMAWEGDLEDSITAGSDENPDDDGHITVTFPLSSIPENAPAVFFRIEEE
jgi:hypothetical protein